MKTHAGIRNPRCPSCYAFNGSLVTVTRTSRSTVITLLQQRASARSIVSSTTFISLNNILNKNYIFIRNPVFVSFLTDFLCACKMYARWDQKISKFHVFLSKIVFLSKNAFFIKKSCFLAKIDQK